MRMRIRCGAAFGRLVAFCLALVMAFPVIAYAKEPTEVPRGTVQNFKENPQLSVQSAKTKLKLNRRTCHREELINIRSNIL